MPQSVLPDDIDSTIRIMRNFITNPIDLEGKSIAELLRRKRRKAITRKKRSSAGVADGGDDDAVAQGRPAKRRKTKRAAELQQFKSAAYIEDSDDAAEADEGYYARELELQQASRAKMMALGHSAFGDAGIEAGKRKKLSTQAFPDTAQWTSDDEKTSDNDPTTARRESMDSDAEIPLSARPPRRPPVGGRPAPRRKVRNSSPSAPRAASRSGVLSEAEGVSSAASAPDDSDPEGPSTIIPRPSAKRRIFAESDDDED